MTKIICVALDGGLLESNSYKGPSGTQYIFDKGVPTEVPIKEDADFFLKCGDGQLFKKADTINMVKESVKKKVKKVVKKEKQEKMVDGKFNPGYPWTEKELYELNKDEQTKFLKQLGGVNQMIPRLEKNRVSTILNLLEGGSK